MKRISVSWRIAEIRRGFIEVSDDATPEEVTQAAVEAALSRSDGALSVEAVHWETEDGKQFGGRF